MDTEEPTTWQNYEEVARYLVEKMSDKLGLGLDRVEGKQTLVGEATTWEIDGKGVKTGDGSIVVIECRRYPDSKLKQAAIAALAYTISDVGASGGIVVTPTGIQSGGKAIAAKEGIKEIRLDENSTTTAYVLKFLNDVFIGVPTAKLTITAFPPNVRITKQAPPLES